MHYKVYKSISLLLNDFTIIQAAQGAEGFVCPASEL